MPESLDTVAAWLTETFGPAPSNFRIAARANEEMAEALRAISAEPDNPHAAVEAADVIIVLCRLAAAAKLDWDAFEVSPKMVPALFATTTQYFTDANKWMARLLIALALDDNHPSMPHFLTNIYVSLQHAIMRYDMAPVDMIEGKMAINRGRTWGKNADGTGYHIRADKRAA